MLCRLLLTVSTASLSSFAIIVANANKQIRGNVHSGSDDDDDYGSEANNGAQAGTGDNVRQ